jgi:hypothetical protein
MPSFPPAHRVASPGAPVAPYRDKVEGSPHTLPHTSIDKAVLCDALLPFLTGLREALWAITAKDPGAYPGREAIFMGQILLADVRRLLRGERMAHYVNGLAITDDLANRFGLALKVSTMETAAGLFRKRYHGFHPALGKPAWYLCGDHAVEDARQLLPRAEIQAGDKNPTDPEITTLRDKLAARIEQLKRTDVYNGPPQPLHTPGGREASKEVALRDWPRIS